MSDGRHGEGSHDSQKVIVYKRLLRPAQQQCTKTEIVTLPSKPPHLQN